MKIEDDPTGGIDGVTLALQMALLYAVDLNVIHRREDGEGNSYNQALGHNQRFASDLVFIESLYGINPSWLYLKKQHLHPSAANLMKYRRDAFKQSSATKSTKLK